MVATVFLILEKIDIIVMSGPLRPCFPHYSEGSTLDRKHDAATELKSRICLQAINDLRGMLCHASLPHGQSHHPSEV